MKSLRQILENEAASVSTTSGAFVDVPKPMKFKKGSFSGCSIFEVDQKCFEQLMKAPKPPRHSYSRYIKDPELLNEVRTEIKSNPKKSILAQCNKSNAMVYLRKMR